MINKHFDLNFIASDFIQNLDFGFFLSTIYLKAIENTRMTLHAFALRQQRKSSTHNTEIEGNSNNNRKTTETQNCRMEIKIIV